MTTKNINRYIIMHNRNIIDDVYARMNDPKNGCSVIIPHVCDNLAVFSNAFCAVIDKYFPIVKTNFQLAGKQSLGQTQFIEVAKNKTSEHNLIIANMVAQNGFKSSTNIRPINYAALSYCMNSVNAYAKDFKKQKDHLEIHCPKFGTGSSGGNWKFILDLIHDTWSKHDSYIYVK